MMGKGIGDVFVTGRRGRSKDQLESPVTINYWYESGRFMLVMTGQG